MRPPAKCVNIRFRGMGNENPGYSGYSGWSGDELARIMFASAGIQGSTGYNGYTGSSGDSTSKPMTLEYGLREKQRSVSRKFG